MTEKPDAIPPLFRPLTPPPADAPAPVSEGLDKEVWVAAMVAILSRPDTIPDRAIEISRTCTELSRQWGRVKNEGDQE